MLAMLALPAAGAGAWTQVLAGQSRTDFSFRGGFLYASWQVSDQTGLQDGSSALKA